MADSPASSLSSLASEDFIEDLIPDLGPRAHYEVTRATKASTTPPPAKRLKKTPATAAAEARSPSPAAASASAAPASTTAAATAAAGLAPPPSLALAAHDDDRADTDISSDSFGDIPGSPSLLAQFPDDDAGHEQVTVCQWDGCMAGDLGDMDALVHHIHDDHIGSRQKRYACEWEDCVRKGMPHASGYALRAHMRSHTREKPFYCALPECDRSFTRSDALAKHMRTVHETEALRPSDPVPKNHNSYPLAVVNSALAAPTASLLSPSLHSTAATAAGSSLYSQQQQQAPQPARPQRLRLIVSAKRSADGHDPASAAAATAAAAAYAGDKDSGVPQTLSTPELDALAAAAAATERLQPSLSSSSSHILPAAAATSTAMMAPLLPLLLPHGGGIEEVYPGDVALTPDERALPPHQLFRLLRRQLHWAQDESRRLRGEVDVLERRRRREWTLKELLLENVMETELHQHDVRQRRRQQRRKQRRLARQQQKQQTEAALLLLPPPLSPTTSEHAAANTAVGGGDGGSGNGAGVSAGKAPDSAPGTGAGADAPAADAVGAKIGVKRSRSDNDNDNDNDDAAAVVAATDAGAVAGAGASGNRPEAAAPDKEVGGDEQSVSGTRVSARSGGAGGSGGGGGGGGVGGGDSGGRRASAAAEGRDARITLPVPRPAELPEPRKPALLPMRLPRTFADGTVWAPYDDDTVTAAAAGAASSVTAAAATAATRDAPQPSTR